ILTREAVLCFPGDSPKAMLVKNSPLLFQKSKYLPDKGIVLEPIKIANTKRIAGSTKKETYELVLKELEETNFFPTYNQMRQSLKESVDFPVAEKKEFSKFIETENLEKDSVLSSVFGAYIGMYKKSLIISGIKGVRIFLENPKMMNGFDRPFVRQIVYGRDETADICLRSSILFADKKFYIFGMKD
ncbi:MAG: hypothetical protein WCK03_04905, partial [Candidatus Taylorbacteria bacterium]